MIEFRQDCEYALLVPTSMGVRLTKHTVYDLQYPLVRITKYRKQISGKIDRRITRKGVFGQMAEEYHL